MTVSIKSRIHEMVDEIENEAILQMLMEDIASYTSSTDIIDELSETQLTELENALSELDNNKGISWDTFKQEMSEWTKL